LKLHFLRQQSFAVKLDVHAGLADVQQFVALQEILLITLTVVILAVDLP